MSTIEISPDRTTGTIGRDVYRAAEAAHQRGETTELTLRGEPVASVTPLPAREPARPLLQLWSVTPDVAVGVDDSPSIVLVTTEGKGPRWTLSNAGALRQALDQAQAYAAQSAEAGWRVS